MFMIDSPAGTGGTSTESFHCAHLRSLGTLVLSVASTGIGGLQLPGGWTAHSMFKLPLDDISIRGSMCNISVES